MLPLPELGPNKFQERPSRASRMQENLLAAGIPPRTVPGSLQHSQTLQLVGSGLEGLWS